MHTARLWKTDLKKEGRAWKRALLSEKLLCWVDATGQKLLSQATDITLIFRGQVAIYSHVCLPVLKTAKIRGKCPSGGQVKAGVRCFDFRFCRVRNADEIFLPQASNTHKADHTTDRVKGLTPFFLMSSSQCVFLSEVEKCHLLCTALLSLVTYAIT